MRLGLRSAFLCGVALFIFSCSDPKALSDENVAIKNHNWSYVNRAQFEVKIDDVEETYNVYMNLRHTADYKYSNLFVLIKEVGPDQKPITRRYEFKLAKPDGEWLGKGSGNLFSYQLPIKTRYKFPVAGTYHFSIEQNMRDNPLKEVTDVGLRVEKAK